MREWILARISTNTLVEDGANIIPFPGTRVGKNMNLKTGKNV